MYHDGFVFHATLDTLRAEGRGVDRTPAWQRPRALHSPADPAQSASPTASVDRVMKPCLSTIGAASAGGGGYGFAQVADRPRPIRSEGGDVDEADDLGIHPRFGDDDATPGMADQNHRTVCSASARWVAATSSASEVRGFCTAVTL